MRIRWWAAPGAAVAVALLAACGSSPAASSPAASSPRPAASSGGAAGSAAAASTSASGIRTVSAKGTTVLTTAQGFTIYWFAIDTPSRSKCTGSCAAFWPPLTGRPTLAAGTSLAGKLGTIRRSGGVLQATYAGHPLYLYRGDTAAGQLNGNQLNADGGLWWATTPSGAKLSAATRPAPSASASASSGGGW